jgi:hypothetical protein
MKLGLVLERSVQELTNRAFSLAVNVSMYLSQVLLINDPSPSQSSRKIIFFQFR